MKIIITIFYTVALIFTFAITQSIPMVLLLFCLIASVVLGLDAWRGEKVVKDKRFAGLLACQLPLFILVFFLKENVFLFIPPIFALFFVLNFFIAKNSKQLFVLDLFTILVVWLNLRCSMLISDNFFDLFCVFILHCTQIVSIISICLKEFLAKQTRNMNLSVLITVFFTTAVVVFSFCAGNKNVAVFYFSLALIGFIAFAAFYWSRIVKNRGAIIVTFCQLICLVIMMSDKNCSSVGLLFCGFFLVNFFIGKSSLQVSVLNLFTTLFLSFCIACVMSVDVKCGFGLLGAILFLYCTRIISIISICLKEMQTRCNHEKDQICKPVI